MRCSKARAYISDGLDDRLDESRGLQLSGHLDQCPDCQQHQFVLQRGQAVLREEMVEPPENFDWKVQLKIQQALREKAAVAEPEGHGWGFWRPALASAASVAALVLIGGVFLLEAPVRDAGPAGVARPAEFAAAPLSTAPAAQVEQAAAEPDLSGGMRANPLRLNAGSNGFGIRTVASEQFTKASPFPDPLPVQEGDGHWRHEREGESVEIRRVLLEDGHMYFIFVHRVSEDAALNLDGRQSTLRVRRAGSGTPSHRSGF
ncbi:hypothetical protein DRQ53_01155 [bacterium]|nr:MAG: hypothetical protein DRQ53_01155 [bacterium]